MGLLPFLEESVQAEEIEVPAPGRPELGLNQTAGTLWAMVDGGRSHKGSEGTTWGGMGQQAEQVRRGEFESSQRAPGCGGCRGCLVPGLSLAA